MSNCRINGNHLEKCDLGTSGCSADHEKEDLHHELRTARDESAALQGTLDGTRALLEAARAAVGNLECELHQAEAHQEHHAREVSMQPKCTACISEPNAVGPGCPCMHAPCRHDYNRLSAEIAATVSLAKTPPGQRAPYEPSPGTIAVAALLSERDAALLDLTACRNTIAKLEAKLAALKAWDDADDEWTAAIAASFPTRSGSHDEYAQAMKMVGNRRSKGSLVALVNHLLFQAKPKSLSCTIKSPYGPCNLEWGHDGPHKGVYLETGWSWLP